MSEVTPKKLRHLLPKKYTYTIVADRGFGNLRFAEHCESAGFSFVLRSNDNLNVEINGEKKNLKDFSEQTTSFDAYVSKWKKNFHFLVTDQLKLIDISISLTILLSNISRKKLSL